MKSLFLGSIIGLAVVLAPAAYAAPKHDQPSAAQKYAKLPPAKQEIARASGLYLMEVRRPDGSYLKSTDADVTNVQAYIQQFDAGCASYVLDELDRGSLVTPANIADAKVACIMQNVQQAKMNVIVRSIAPPLQQQQQ